jgi:hypothetical protein
LQLLKAKRTKEVVIAEARAIKAEKVLAEANQGQSKREQAIVKRIDALSTSFGSKCCLASDSALSYFANMRADYDIFVMRHNKLERSSSFVMTKPKNLYSMSLSFWSGVQLHEREECALTNLTCLDALVC